MVRSFLLINIYILLPVIILTSCRKPLLFKEESVIGGLVVDGLTNMPIPDITVSLEGTNNAAKTGSDGKYKLVYDTRRVNLLFSKEGYISDKYFLELVNNEDNITIPLFELYPIPSEGEGIYLIMNKSYIKLNPAKIESVMTMMDIHRNILYEHIIIGGGIEIPYSKAIKFLHFGLVTDILSKFTPVTLSEKKKIEWPPAGSKGIKKRFRSLGEGKGITFIFELPVGEYALVVPKAYPEIDFGFMFNIVGSMDEEEL